MQNPFNPNDPKPGHWESRDGSQKSETEQLDRWVHDDGSPVDDTQNPNYGQPFTPDPNASKDPNHWYNLPGGASTYVPLPGDPNYHGGGMGGGGAAATNAQPGLADYGAWSSLAKNGAAGAYGQQYYNANPQQQARNEQISYIQQLQAQANGTAGPSAAQMQLRRGTQQAQSNQLGMAANRRGISGTGALYGAEQNQSQIGLQGNQAENILKLQQQQQARAALANATGQMRQQDQANAGMEMQQAQMQDQMLQFFLSQGMSYAEAQKAAQQAQQALSQTQSNYLYNLQTNAQAGDDAASKKQQFAAVNTFTDAVSSAQGMG
jgi:hypothetical protein